VWTVECGHAAGLRLRYPQNPDYVHGSSERPVQEALAGRLCRGDVFYDIGANVGFFSLLAARLVGPGGYVCAFEPHPRNAATVAANAALNAMPHLRVFEVAVGAFARRDELLMTEWDGGATLSGLPLGPSAPVARAAVEVVPLDEFVPAHGLPLPTFVKIDVEGAEVEVIDGMVRTIEQSRPVLLYEVDDGDEGVFRRRWDELDRRVRGLGYDVTRLENAYPGLKWYVGHSIAMPDGCGAAQPISKVAPAPRVVGSPNERGGG
jgi:FkbM family methyltransferase